MKSLSKVLPIIGGAVAGAIVALLVAHGGTTKTVTEQVQAASSGNSVPAASTTTTSGGGMSVNAIYKRDSAGVVDIIATTKTDADTNGFFSEPTESEEEEDEGAGVVYNKQGDILTDEHVVADATKVKVNFQNGDSVSAKVLGTDASSDVAVLKVDVKSSELHPIPFADSSDAQVGDSVVAIGSPFGYPETTTSGIVSAVNRNITAPNNYTIPGAIQTDAAINPGNSGGPLLDSAGDVLGLNDQIETGSDESDQSAGIGFATPANEDVKVANTIIAGKKVEHAYVGVSLVDSTSGGAEIAKASGSVVAGSPAAKAGLKAGDIITAVDGKKITDTDDFISVISNYKPGNTVTLTITTSAKKTVKIKVTLGNRPETAPTES